MSQKSVVDDVRQIAAMYDRFRKAICLGNTPTVPGKFTAMPKVKQLPTEYRWQICRAIYDQTCFESSLRDKGYFSVEGKHFLWRMFFFSDSSCSFPSSNFHDRNHTFRDLRVFTVEEYAHFMIMHQPEVQQGLLNGSGVKEAIYASAIEYVGTNLSRPSK